MIRSFHEHHSQVVPGSDHCAIDNQGSVLINQWVKQLQKENRRLREELDILKRVAVLLVKR